MANKLKSSGLLKNIVFISVVITLALSPWVNSDSLIIPKGIILFCLGLFLVPELILKKSNFTEIKRYRLLLIFSSTFVFQMIIVLLISDAPFEQQLYGRTGRALGFITFISLILIMLTVSLYGAIEKSNTINNGILIACALSSIYSILQFFGYDIFNWVTLTNGIIGTLGNPNFQSSLVAMALMPALTVTIGNKTKPILTLLILSLLLYTLYLCESTQGYVASLASIGIFISIYLWFKNKQIFFIFNTIFIMISVVAIFGMLNQGPLKSYLYKVSVQSRGEMWRTSFSAIKDNPWFGVGLDSFGDYSLFYRDLKTVNGVNEFTDNAHNFFLQFAVTGGLLLALSYICIIGLSFYSFFSVLKRMSNFNPKFIALFSAWFSFQLQSFISPANISMLVWNFVLSGFLVGVSSSFKEQTVISQKSKSNSQNFTKPFSYLFLIFALVLMYPWFNSDKIAWRANETGDGRLAIMAAKMFPESSIRYTRITLALYNSQLFDQSLDVARSSVKFNPRSVQGWFLILINPRAPLEERVNARNHILKLDPFNKDVNGIKL